MRVECFCSQYFQRRTDRDKCIVISKHIHCVAKLPPALHICVLLVPAYIARFVYFIKRMFVFNGPPTRYVKLRVAHEPGMPGTFSPPPISEETAS